MARWVSCLPEACVLEIYYYRKIKELLTKKYVFRRKKLQKVRQ